ncbi:hypothetical protein BDD12DRAFT_750432 [Trichophaea hybrida]|nr:hypothetical protein BDD12DRAFT_750432 [Trichophaea hybrida]
MVRAPFTLPPNSYNGIHDIPWDRLEDPAMYKPGGYHPLELGDELHNGCYQIIHRLGHGGYSTVWLALDQHCERTATAVLDVPRSRHVAIKIGIANNEKDETAILRQLRAQPLLRVRNPALSDGRISHTQRPPFEPRMLAELIISELSLWFRYAISPGSRIPADIIQLEGMRKMRRKCGRLLRDAVTAPCWQDFRGVSRSEVHSKTLQCESRPVTITRC